MLSRRLRWVLGLLTYDIVLALFGENKRRRRGLRHTEATELTARLARRPKTDSLITHLIILISTHASIH